MPTRRIDALLLVVPDQVGTAVRRHARALAGLGVVLRSVERHGPRGANAALDRLWLTAGIRPAEVVVVDGCDVECQLPDVVARVAPADAEGPLAALRERRTRGDLPMVPDEPAWTIGVNGADPALEWMHDSWLAMVDGVIGTIGSPLTAYAPARREVLVGGVYSGLGPATDALRAPDWSHLAGELRADAPLRRVLDLRTGLVHHEGTSTVGRFRAITFASRATPGLGVLRAEGGGARPTADGPLATPAAHGAVIARGAAARGAAHGTPRRQDRHPTIMEVAGEPGGVAVAARDTVSGTGASRRIDRIAAFRTGRYRRPSAAAAGRMLRDAERAGVDGLIRRQREAWATRWAEMGIRLEGDLELQRALNFALFHLDSSVASQAEAPLGPRGLTGPSYKAHVFWDSECYVLPFFAATRPAAARAMLAYRARRLDAAREVAAQAGLRGAWLPWESAADGRDVTPRWVHGEDAVPIRVWTGERELHIVADVAWAVDHYVSWSGDTRFGATDGLRILVETARFWASRLERDVDGSAHIRGVIGPDEYHELVDDNAYTNVMARWNLRAAAGAVRRAGERTRPGVSARVELPDREELEDWVAVADRIVDGYDPGTRIYEQFAGFHRLDPVKIAELTERPVPADVFLGRERVAHSQVVKQTDVLLLHHLVPGEVAPGSLLANLDYYEPRTSHGSSLSPGTHATLLARVGRFEAALDALGMAAYMDLDDRSGKAAEGLHIPTMGAFWQALVMGFGGIGPVGDALAIDPHLPPSWTQLEIPLRFRGRRIRIALSADRIVVRGARGVAFDVPGAGRLVSARPTLELRRDEEGWHPTARSR